MGRPVAGTTPPPDSAARARTGRRVLLNTGALAGSSLWRILISFGLQLLIAHRLGPEGLGQYTAVLAYLNVCQVLSELGLPQLLVRDLSQRPAERVTSFRTALLLQGGLAFVVWAGLSLLSFLLPFGATTRLALIVVGATLPFFAVTSVCETLFQAGERMELVMGVEVTINTLILVASGLVLWRGGGVVQLGGVLVLTQAISSGLCLLLLRRSGLLAVQPEPQPPVALGVRAGYLLRRARPFYALALSNVLLQRLDILLLSVLAGEVITGIYSAAYLVVRVLLILSQTYWQALYPTLSRLRQQAVDQYESLARLAVRFGLLALLPAAAIGSVVAEPLIGLIFSGEAYGLSGQVFRVLIWTAPLYQLALFAVNLLLVEHRPARGLQIPGVHILSVLLLLPGLALASGAVGAAGAVTAATFVGAAWGVALVGRLPVPVGLPRRTGRLLGITGLTALATLAVLVSLPGAYAWLLAAAVGGCVYLLGVYGAGLVTLEDWARVYRLFK